MSALTAKRKAEIADELEVAASWVGGPRAVKLLALSKEIAGLDTDAAADAAAKQLADQDAPTVKDADTPTATDTPEVQTGAKAKAGGK